MKVLYINNLGGGYADYVEVADGTTVEQFFSKRMHDCHPEDFLIRVNRHKALLDKLETFPALRRVIKVWLKARL